MPKGEKIKINLEIEVDLGLFKDALQYQGIYRMYSAGQIANTLTARVNQEHNYQEVVKVTKATIN